MRLPRAEQLSRIADLCRLNAEALLASLQFCVQHGIGAFRINSQILPIRTHPQVGYNVHELPHGKEIIARYRECGAFARHYKLRLSFHPDQFVVLNSPNAKTLLHSLAELNYQAEVAEWVGADTINIHAGGAYGDKVAALRTLRQNIERLPVPVRLRLTLENDDRIYTPADLLPVCRDVGVPLVHDVHHHRCLPDGLTVEATTERAAVTWNREPLFHISSPLQGWRGPRPERHHDFIATSDFPKAWRHRALTVEVEAKAKELAVLKLLAWLGDSQ